MSVMDKFLNAMKLNDEEDEYYDDDFYDDEPEQNSRRSSGNTREPAATEEPVKKQPPKVTPMRQMKKMPGTGMEVCVIKPTTLEDEREITETLLANRAVVLNLEGVDLSIARRILDFTSGSCFAMSGNLQQISQFIFIVTPASVDISGDFQEFLSGSFDVPINNGLMK